MPGMVRQRSAHTEQAGPSKIFVSFLALGIYSILGAIISIHFFQLQLVPYILGVSVFGFIVSATIYFLSDEMRKSGFKKSYMGAFQVMGDVFGRGILLALYFVVFLIPGVFVATFADRLQTKKKPSKWADRTDQEYNLERARDQW